VSFKQRVEPEHLAIQVTPVFDFLHSLIVDRMEVGELYETTAEAVVGLASFA
jgi:hypothetical protein